MIPKKVLDKSQYFADNRGLIICAGTWLFGIFRRNPYSTFHIFSKNITCYVKLLKIERTWRNFGEIQAKWKRGGAVSDCQICHLFIFCLTLSVRYSRVWLLWELLLYVMDLKSMVHQLTSKKFGTKPLITLNCISIIRKIA